MMKRMLILLTIMSIFSDTGAQENLPVRKAAVAGQFYPAEAEALEKYFEKEFNQITVAPNDKKVRAIIVPHAGYMYSGRTAAWAFATLREKNIYKNVFIIGSSHIAAFDGASIFHGAAFETPLGHAEINTEITSTLQQNNIFKFPQQYQTEDHVLEVEIPFLQYILEPGFKIIPITIGTKSSYALDKITEALKPYFTPDNLFVISTDLSHYPSYSDAVKADSAVVQSILSGNPQTFDAVVRSTENAGIKNYVTAICGYSAVYILMSLATDKDGFSYEKLKYSNSGDVSGDFNRVVGYASIAVRECALKETQQKKDTFTISENDKKIMFNIARNSIESKLNNEARTVPDTLSDMLNEKCGVFVTLHLNNKLRGCIGTFRQDRELAINIHEMALAAAFSDPRFDPLTKEEYKNIELEISVLTPMQKIDSVNQIVLGKHGIYIKRGNMTGTFLPQVATETGWTLEEFLGHCSRDKAGIGWEGWKDEETEIFIYETIILNE